MPRLPGFHPTAFFPHFNFSKIGSSLLHTMQIAYSLLPSALCLLLLFVTHHASLITVHAQGATATLSGTVKDQNGAVIPGANIAVISIAQGFERLLTTNGEGTFVVPLLPPGKYTVKVEREGFSTSELRDVVLNVNDQVAINIRLSVGDISQTVLVEGGSRIDESTAVATTVDRQFVENLPLNGRSFQSLITLTPGLVRTSTNSAEPGQFSVNGQRADANYFTVDGVSANIGISANLTPGQTVSGSLPGLSASGGTNNLVSIDALQEFRVQTSTYDAEFGRTPGAQISIATRSGTNQFHGTLFEYFRNDVLDANDWFFNARGLRKAALRQNDFGGVIGGPLLLPRFGEGGDQPWYNGRNRTFFFFSYEGLRLRQPRSLETNVPSVSLRQSAVESIKPILNAFPLPTGPENPANRFAPFTAGFSNPSTLNAVSVRIDNTFARRLILFGRYNYAPSETVQRNAGLFSLNTLSSTKSKTQTLTLGGTLFFPSGITNELRANYSHYTGSGSFTLDTFGGAIVPDDSLLFPSFTSRQNAVITVISAIPGVRFGGLMIGELAGNLNRQVNLIDNFSVNSSNHAFKFGIDYRHLSPIVSPRTYSQLALFLAASQYVSGRPLQVQVRAESGSREPIFKNLSLYGQDTWRINRRLVLTYGLRWELNPSPHEKHGNDARTVIGFDDPTTTALAPVGTRLYKTTYGNFAPRIGMSYQLGQQSGGETILRGGFGIFYDTGNAQAGSAYSQGFFPFEAFKRVINAPFPLTPSNAAPPSFNPIPSNAFIYAFDPDLKLPYTLQWNVAMQRSLGSAQSISVSYVAARGRRLLREDVISRLPEFFSIFVIRNVASSNYDSLQTVFQRRLARGLQAHVSYTWAKSLDNASNDSTPFPSPLKIDPRQDRGPSDFDYRHVFSTAVTYDIPTPKTGVLRSTILRGWSIDSIVSARSAFTVNIISGATLFGTSLTARPDLLVEVPVYIRDSAAPGGKRINRAAFVAPPVGPDGTPIRQGSLGRNSLRGFPLFQTDLTVRRQFDLTENLNLQFRTDFFNIFNHPNFGSVCNDMTTCSPSIFGQATQMLNNSLGSGGVNGGFNPLYQVGGPRSIQFSLKAQF